jgi:NADH dehydrogenase FAD-containing subunit
MPFVTVSLYQSAQSILTQFSGSLQQRAIQNFKATGVKVVLGVQVGGCCRSGHCSAYCGGVVSWVQVADLVAC